MSRPPLPRHSVIQPLDPSYRLIPLTQGQNAIVDTDDLERLSNFTWCARKITGTNTFYAYTNPEQGVVLAMHQVVVGITFGEVDHFNHDTLDNRKKNLRPCTHAQNCQNQKIKKINKSGFKGVHREHNRWIAQIRIDGRSRVIGRFNTPEEAANCYDRAARKLYGEFAYTNHDRLSVVGGSG